MRRLAKPSVVDRDVARHKELIQIWTKIWTNLGLELGHLVENPDHWVGDLVIELFQDGRLHDSPGIV